MIDVDNILDEIKPHLGLWCPGGGEDTDLAAMAEYIVANKIPMISVTGDNVPTLWPWLENADVAINARFYLDARVARHAEKQISDLAARMNGLFKQGASGAQVFIRFADLELFVSQLHAIRNDLFFNKTLSIGLDIGEIGPYDWGKLFELAEKIQAASILFVMPNDTGDKSDFVGRVYSALDTWNGAFHGDLHFALGQNFIRMEQAMRLVQKMRPELMQKIRFFAPYPLG